MSRTTLAIAALTVAVFAPSLEYGFLEWDDDRNFLKNPHYRGLGWAQVRWAFTSAPLGHWIPLTWLTLSFDFALWGMNPVGYHLTNVLLHAANAALVFLLARRLLPSTAGAVFAALFFALHPLRVESVAWITERRDVLSAFFCLLTLLAYLRGRIAVALGCYALGLLSKSMLMSLPLVLLVLDVYPLRRAAGRWREVIVEKLPFLALAVVAAIVSLKVVIAEVGLTSTAVYPPAARIAMAFHSLAFYAWKTLLPLDLSPLYPLPPRITLASPRFLVSAIAVVGIAAVLIVMRRRWPAALAVGIVYALTLAPVSGIVHNGPQLVADRYSYLSCLGIALLLGAGLTAVSGRRALRVALAGAAALWIAGLAILTREQLPVWRDTEGIWIHAIAIEPECAFCHGQLGALLGNRGDLAGAIANFERVVQLRPDVVRHRGNLGLALLLAQRPAEAIPHFERMLADEPNDAETRRRLEEANAALRRRP